MGEEPEPEKPRERGTPATTWRNYTQPMPLDRKLRLVYRNLLTRVRHRTDCCGHPGQPGC